MCAKCAKPEEVVRADVNVAALEQEFQAKLHSFRLRTQKSVLRKIEKGQLTKEEVLEMDSDKPEGGLDDDDDDLLEDDEEDDGAGGKIQKNCSLQTHLMFL